MIYILIPLILLNKSLILPLMTTVTLLLLSPYLPLWGFKYLLFCVFFSSLLNFFYKDKFGKPLSFKSLTLLKQSFSLKDSLSHYKKFFIPVIPLLIYIYVIPQSTLPLYPTVLVYLLLPVHYLWKQRKEEISLEVGFIPENETYKIEDDEYPLEKTTKGFTGQKTFEVPGKRPHVIVLFLESFRGKNIGALGADIGVTPNFDKLSEEGIFFTNFHSNATQTLKGMIHALYGLPALFGSEFEMSEKDIADIKLKGLPDLFLQRGYNTVFTQGGDNKFHFKDTFFHAHNFQEIYDLHDIKKSDESAYGTSWGVHDEYLYNFILHKLKTSNSKMFLMAATTSNHHPFTLPENYEPKEHFETKDPFYERFLQTMSYTDHMLGYFVEELKKCGEPVHLHITADHGFDKDDLQSLKQSIKHQVTHIPYLILPINCGEVSAVKMTDVASHIDIAPTIMDLYNLKGHNNSIGSSLVRERKNPFAYILNQIPYPPLYAIRDNKHLNITPDLAPFKHIEHLFDTKKVASNKENTLLDVSKEKITVNQLKELLLANQNIRTLILSDAPLIHSLKLNVLRHLKKLKLDNNLLIDEEDFKDLPKKLESLSIKGCYHLNDKALDYIKSCPLKELSLSSRAFSKEGLNEFAKHLYSIEKLVFDDAHHLTDAFFENLPYKTLRSLKIYTSSSLSDKGLDALSNHPLQTLLIKSSTHITDDGVGFLSGSQIGSLFLENAPQVTDKGLKMLSNVPLHSFSISNAQSVTEDGIAHLNHQTLQKIYCMGCNVKERVDEHLHSNKASHIRFFVSHDDNIEGFKLKMFDEL